MIKTVKSYRKFAIPLIALDKHTDRGKGIDTTARLAKAAPLVLAAATTTGHRSNWVASAKEWESWDDEERSKSHGGARAYDDKKGETPVSRFFDEGALVINEWHKCTPDVFRDRCRQWYVGKEERFGYRKSKTKWMSARAWEGWMKPWLLAQYSHLQTLEQQGVGVRVGDGSDVVVGTTTSSSSSSSSSSLASTKKATRKRKKQEKTRDDDQEQRQKQRRISDDDGGDIDDNQEEQREMQKDDDDAAAPTALKKQKRVAKQTQKERKKKTKKPMFSLELTSLLSASDLDKIRSAPYGQQVTASWKRPVYMTEQVRCIFPLLA